MSFIYRAVFGSSKPKEATSLGVPGIEPVPEENTEIAGTIKLNDGIFGTNCLDTNQLYVRKPSSEGEVQENGKYTSISATENVFAGTFVADTFTLIETAEIGAASTENYIVKSAPSSGSFFVIVSAENPYGANSTFCTSKSLGDGSSGATSRISSVAGAFGERITATWKDGKFVIYQSFTKEPSTISKLQDALPVTYRIRIIKAF